MKRQILARVGVGAALWLMSGMLMVGTGAAAHAATPGPTGCVAQGANGAIAAGTLTDSFTQPSQSPPAASCTFAEPAGTGGGYGGGDSVSWSVTVTGTAPPATDTTGATPCGFKANATTPPSWTASGSGQASGGFGCIPGGDNVTLAAG